MMIGDEGGRHVAPNGPSDNTDNGTDNNNDSINLEALLRTMSLDHQQADCRKVDQLAEAMREKLGVDLGPAFNRQLAEKFAQLNLLRQEEQQQHQDRPQQEASLPDRVANCDTKRQFSTNGSPSRTATSNGATSRSSNTGGNTHVSPTTAASSSRPHPDIRQPKAKTPRSFEGGSPSMSSNGKNHNHGPIRGLRSPRRHSPGRSASRGRSASAKAHVRGRALFQRPNVRIGPENDRRYSSPSTRKKGSQEEKKDPEELFVPTKPSFECHPAAVAPSPQIPNSPRPPIDRVPSRSDSPHSRPGGSKDDDDYSRVPAYSPARSKLSSHPRGGSVTPRNRNGGADEDDDSVQKPPTPREQKPPPPTARAFSQSPKSRGNSGGPVQNNLDQGMPMLPKTTATPSVMGAVAHPRSVPDLAIPVLQESDGTTAAFFTPPPQHHPGRYCGGVDGLDGNGLQGTRADSAGEEYCKTGTGKVRRKDNTPDYGITEIHKVAGGESGFVLGVSEGKSKRGVNSRRGARRALGPVAAHNVHVMEKTSMVTNNVDSGRSFDPPKEHSREPQAASASLGSEMLSPMDCSPDEPIFSMGVGDAHSRRRVGIPRVKRGAAVRRATNINANLASSSILTTTIGGQDDQVTSKNGVRNDGGNFEVLMDCGGRISAIAAKREEAKSKYMACDYPGSIHSYTEAIEIAGQPPAELTREDEPKCDTLALLLSNRAAAFMMVGAYDAASTDCQIALGHVSAPPPHTPFSNESGFLLRIKILTRMGRALIKMGSDSDAHSAFEKALKSIADAKAYALQFPTAETAGQQNVTLPQLETDAALGRADATKLKELNNSISNIRGQALRSLPDQRKLYVEALGQVNKALQISNGSLHYYEAKLDLLASLKRWREVAGCCERLAAINVRLDHVFQGELAHLNPFPDVPPADHLKLDFFHEARDENGVTANLKLTSRGAAEAVLRLPYKLTKAYLRSLRLEERYPAAESALRSLEELVSRGKNTSNKIILQSSFDWLGIERSKLDRTRKGRERGDELFRNGEYDLAAAQYASCLSIDSHDGSAVGGRLHAVLHCNRAACLMAGRHFDEAVDECTAALRIHTRYMKAMLRRARCYYRLQRHQEAISEYGKWLQLVEEASHHEPTVTSFVYPCLFDGPTDVTDADIVQVKKELDDAHKAKRRSEAAAAEEAKLRRERARFQDSFPTNSTSPWGKSSAAHQRRENWYSQQQNGPRRWDSFKNQGPRSGGHHHQRTQSEPRNGNNDGRQQHSNSTTVVDSSSHYAVLTLPPHASGDDIKRSYRNLARQWHPDKNNDPEAAEKFRAIQVAYDTLRDAERRRQYDFEKGFHHHQRPY